MKRSFTLRLSEFSAEALVREEGQVPEQVPASLERAVRFYLGDRNSDRPGWAFPGFLREIETNGLELELELVVDEDLLSALEEEAGRQGVSVSRMAEHAVLYYVAELNAGRVTQRILDCPNDDDAEGEA